MIPSSGLYRIPRGDAGPRSAEAVRFARSEYGTPSLTWMLNARPTAPGLLSRFAASLSAVFGGRGARPAHGAHASASGTGIAAVHFAGEPAHVHAAPSPTHPYPLWDVRPTGGLLLPSLGADEASDVCDRQP